MSASVRNALKKAMSQELLKEPATLAYCVSNLDNTGMRKFLHSLCWSRGKDPAFKTMFANELHLMIKMECK